MFKKPLAVMGEVLTQALVSAQGIETKVLLGQVLTKVQVEADPVRALAMVWLAWSRLNAMPEEGDAEAALSAFIGLASTLVDEEALNRAKVMFVRWRTAHLIINR